MIKILHAADFHLDSPFESLPEEKAMQRRREGRALISSMADLARREAVDLIVLAGDLLDSARSYYETGEALLSVFSKLDIPIFITPGNHDYYGATSPYAVLKFPPNVHIFRTGTPEKVEIKDKPCTVWGAAFTSEAAPALLSTFRIPEGDGKRAHIMVLHGAALEPESKYNPIDEADIARSGLQYLALGHRHTFSGLQKSGDTYWAYPGCPEGRGFDETGEKGVIIAEIETGRVQARFVPLGKRQYRIIDVDLTDRTDAMEAVAAAVVGGTKEDICRIVLTGAYGGALDLGKISDSVADRFFHVVLRDETRLLRDIWTQAEEDTLRGLFLRKMRARYEAGNEAERHKVILAVRYALAAMERGEEWMI